MRLALVAGTTETARIGGISAAGADPERMAHTPSADAEVIAYGRPVFAPAVPVSPTGCPTPALVTRAVREVLGFDLVVLDAGLAARTATPTVPTGADPGGDVRDPEPVPGAPAVFAAARELGRGLPDDELLVGETIPGGTTTALGVLRALGEPFGVSSSLPENPTARKARVVDEGLAASDLSPGEAAGRPLRAVAAMGDPVLAAVAGLTTGALDGGTAVTLAGGTQMLAAAALLRHADVTAELTVATTSFVADDESVDLRDATALLDVDLVVTDPGFEGSDHVATERFCRGEAKEGAGMGGALAFAECEAVVAKRVRERFVGLYERVVADES